MKSLKPKIVKHGSISRQIAIRMAIGATFIMLLSMLIFGLLDYFDRVQTVRKTLNEVAYSTAPGLAGSLWNFDLRQLQLLIDGLTQIPSISHAVVFDDNGVEIARSGLKIDHTHRQIEKRVVLVHQQAQEAATVGELQIVVDLQPLTAAAIERLLPLLITLLIVVSVLGAVFFVLFKRLVTQHLMSIANYLSSLSFNKLQKPLTLPPTARLNNELGMVIESINDMRQQLLGSRLELEDYRQHLENLVSLRTIELQRQQAFTQAVLENTSDGIVACNEHGRLSLMNRASREIHGIGEKDLPPEQWAEHYRLYRADGKTPMTTEDIPLFRAFHGEILHNEQMTIEQQQDGKRLIILASGQALFDQSGAKIGAVVSLHDVTEQKTIEAKLIKAKDAAEAANRTKSMFLANMSHELRTPMNAILGFSDLLRRSPGLSEAQQQNLAIIRKSGDHLLGLINGVLDLAKIETGHIQIERAPFDVVNLILSVVDMVRGRAREKGLQLTVDQSPDFPRHIVEDEIKLRQILINLLSNAVKATERGGVILRLGVERHPTERLIMEVEDTGIGIAPEEQEKIFDAFVQAGSPSKQKGTGLGLAITRRFVALMGGKLTLASTVDEGSTFRVELPLQRARPEDLPEDAPESSEEVFELEPGQPECRVLVVDDQMENWLLLVQLLEKVGFTVRAAENGAEAVARFEDWRPHFIWMDRRMPVLDGVEATRQIRARPDGDAVKIAAVTASSFKQENVELMDAGFDAIVHKPYRPEQIYDCMASLLGLRFVRAAPPAATEPPPEMSLQTLDALAEPIRQALADAIASLDEAQVKALVAEIGNADPALAATLSYMVENYNYQPILDALDGLLSAKICLHPVTSLAHP